MVDIVIPYDRYIRCPLRGWSIFYSNGFKSTNFSRSPLKFQLVLIIFMLTRNHWCAMKLPCVIVQFALSFPFDFLGHITNVTLTYQLTK